MANSNRIKRTLQIVGLIVFAIFIFAYSYYTFTRHSDMLVFNIFMTVLLVALLVLFIVRFKFSDHTRPLFSFLDSKKGEIISVSIVIGVALIMRAILLTEIPSGLMGDESAMIYEAWCIGHYGTDRYGNSLPVYLVSWGSGQNALLTYLTIPFVMLFGMNAFSARIVIYIAINASMIAFYVLVRKLAYRRLAFISLLLFAFLPYTFMMSRFGLESFLLPVMLIFGLLFLVKALKDNPWWFVLSAFFFGLSLYAYAIDFIFLPVFLVGVYIVLLVKKKIHLQSFIVGNIVLFALALPLILFVFVNYFGVEPFNFLGIFAIPKLSAMRDGATGLHIFENIKNLYKLLVYQDDGLLWNTISPFGYILPISFPFAIIGLIKIILDLRYRENRTTTNLIIIVYLIAGLMTALLTTTNSLNHIDYIVPIYILMIGIGIDCFIANKRTCAIVLATIYGIALILFYSYYFSNAYKDKTAEFFGGEINEAIERAESMRGEDTIIVTDIGYINILVEIELTPEEFSSTIVWRDPNEGLRVPITFSHYRYDLDYQGEDVIYLLSNKTEINLDNSFEKIVMTDYTIYYKA